jgi:WD40 repeat protein/serine/threonine protein kinase/DNA-binding XRE family transcriptional regulator
MSMPSTFGKWLKQQRRAAGLTQQELGERVACAPITIKKIEADERRPSRQITERLLRILGIAEADRSALVRLARATGEQAPVTSSTPASTSPSPPILHGYTLYEQIALGGFGAVYRAQQQTVNREVAIKVILPAYADHPDFIRRFEAEAQLVARLEHPHIVPLYDYWREPGSAYLVMRYLRGGSLRTLLQQGPLPLPQVVQIIEQLGAALETAHRFGVIHRDLKPANVLRDEVGNVYLADFGIARELSFQRNADQSGMIIGSPGYLSPEQIRDEEVTPRTDVYALGLLLYELLSGTRPYPNASPFELMRLQLTEPVPLLVEQQHPLGALLDPIIQQATAKSPLLRYEQVSLLVEALREATYNVLSSQNSTAAFLVSPPPSNGGRGQNSIPTLVLDGPHQVINPFKGLRAFDEADAEHFFGRASLINELLRRMAEAGPYSRLTVVVGPSGSGKSSLVRAGLVPALRAGGLPGSEQWFIVTMAPGVRPIDELAQALGRVATTNTGDLTALLRTGHHGLVTAAGALLPADQDCELLLVIDQWEELFTQTALDADRELVLEQIYTAAVDPASRVRVVATLRADFYDRPLLWPGLGELVRHRTIAVAPLNNAELRQAINGPLKQVGLGIEPALVETIINDVAAQPGALPLLQYALTELYEQQQDKQLTLHRYEQIGGVAGALTRRAEALYNALNAHEQEATRQLFLRLVTPGEGSEDTRRRARVGELATAEVRDLHGLRGSQHTLDRFGAARLLMFDRDPLTREPTVEIAHEALIRHWPRLRNWLEEAREQLTLLRRLGLAVAEWEASGRDAGFLLSGPRLATFVQLTSSTMVQLTTDEQQFLEASAAAEAQRAAAERKRQEQEAEARTLARSAGTLRRLAIALGLATLVALVLGGLALAQRNEAVNQGQARATAAALAANERDSALSARATAEAAESEVRRLALAGEALAVLPNQPERALLLALAALPAEPPYPPLIAQALYRSYGDSLVRNQFDGHQEPVRVGAFAPDGTVVATGGDDGNVRLWNPENGQQILVLDIGQPLRGLGFSPDGSRLVTGGADGSAQVWDARSGAQVVRLNGHEQTVSRISFSPDGSRVVTASYDGTARVWDVASGSELVRLEGHNGPLRAATWSPDGQQIATASDDGTARIWDGTTGEERLQLTGHIGLVATVAWAPNGEQLLTGGADGILRLWNASDGTELRRYSGNVGYIWSAGWHPTGELLLAGGFDGAAYLWDVGRSEPIKVLRGHGARLWATAWSADGRQFLTASDDGTVRLWDRTTGLEVIAPPAGAARITATAWHHNGQQALFGRADGSLQLFDLASGAARSLPSLPAQIERVAWHPDGQRLLASSSDGTTRLFDLSGTTLLTLNNVPAAVRAEDWSPDGTTLLAAHDDGSIHFWSLNGEQALAAGDRKLATEEVTAVDWSADGNRIATGHSNGLIRIWEATTGQELVSLNGHGAQVRAVQFSPTSLQLVSASDDGTIRLWGIEGGAALRELRGHTGGVLVIAWNSTGTRLLSGGDDGIARLWDATSGSELRALIGSGGTSSVALWLNGDNEALIGTPQGYSQRWLLDDAAIINDVTRRVCAFYDDAMIRAMVETWRGCE